MKITSQNRTDGRIAGRKAERQGQKRDGDRNREESLECNVRVWQEAVEGSLTHDDAEKNLPLGGNVFEGLRAVHF